MGTSAHAKNRLKNISRGLSNARCDLVSLRDDLKNAGDIDYELTYEFLKKEYIPMWEKLMDLQGDVKLFEMKIAQAVRDTKEKQKS